MRKDMAKVIVHRPRTGRGYGRLRGRPRDLELAPHSESIKHRWKTRACLNENLAPLKRYLQRQIGRPWDAVYSEICANLRVDSTVQQHVRDHLDDFVAFPSFEKDGELWATPRGYPRPRPLRQLSAIVYVCPETGLLRPGPGGRRYWNERWRRRFKAREAARAERMREIAPDRQLHRLKGEWYEVTLKRAPDEREEPYLADRLFYRTGFAHNDQADVVMSAGLWRGDRGDLYGRCGVYAVAKRQLSRRDKRRHGLD